MSDGAGCCCSARCESDEIARLKATIPQWIPVGERLPEPDSIVLVAVHPCWADPYHAIGVWSGVNWYIEDDAPPTHWAPLMPLPELPS